MTSASEENCPQIIASPLIISSRMIAPRINAPWTIAPEDNCQQGKLTVGQLQSRKIAPPISLNFLQK